MLYIIITSFNEPKATLNAVNSFLKQKIKEKFKIIVVDPFPEVKKYLEKNIKDKRVNFFLDPGEGKSHALNLLFKQHLSKNKNDITIFTDGDVYVSEDSTKEILIQFKNPKVGCITGKPVSTNLRSTKYGYWSKVLYSGIDIVRKDIQKKEGFMQCSGYLFAIRNGIINEIPLDVPEDCIIPYLIWKKGYQIGYSDKALVFVQYPTNWKDWIKQRIRTIKAHENIAKLYPDMPRTKSLFTEIRKGSIHTLKQPRTPKEAFWTFQLYLARLYIYYQSFKQAKKKETAFDPAWRDDSEILSAKPRD